MSILSRTWSVRRIRRSKKAGQKAKCVSEEWYVEELGRALHSRRSRRWSRKRREELEVRISRASYVKNEHSHRE